MTPLFRLKGADFAGSVSPTMSQAKKTWISSWRRRSKLVKTPTRAGWGGYRGYFGDSDNHLWEIAHNPFFWIGPSDDDD